MTASALSKQARFGHRVMASCQSGSVLARIFHIRVTDSSCPCLLTPCLKRAPNNIGADFLGRGSDKALFSVKKKCFSVKRGEGFSEKGVW